MIFIKHEIGDSVCYENINNKSNMLCGLTVFTEQEIQENIQHNYNAFVQLKYKEALSNLACISGLKGPVLDFAFIDICSEELSACIKLSPNDRLGLIDTNIKRNTSQTKLFTNNKGSIFYIQDKNNNKLYFMIDDESILTGSTQDITNNCVWDIKSSILNDIKHVLPNDKSTGLVFVGPSVNDMW